MLFLKVTQGQQGRSLKRTSEHKAREMEAELETVSVFHSIESICYGAVIVPGPGLKEAGGDPWEW